MAEPQSGRPRRPRRRRALRAERGPQPHLRQPRVQGHHVPRDPLPEHRQPGARRLPGAVRLDGEPVSGLQPRLRLLLRPEDPQLPGPRHRTRLRHPDRGEDQRRRAAAARTRLPALGGRPHRDGHQRRPVPAGRGPVPADAGDHPGADRPRQPLLDPDQGHADPPRPAAARPGRRGDGRVDGGLGRLHRPRRPVAAGGARHPAARQAAGRLPGAERRRRPLRRADGADPALPHRPAGDAGGDRPGHRRGGRAVRHPPGAASASGRPRVVVPVAGGGVSAPGRAVPAAVPGLGVRADLVPAPDHPAGARDRRALRAGPLGRRTARSGGGPG